MSILVVGSVAFDSIKTPTGEVNRILGGSAVHFSVAASILSKINLVGVVGSDFTEENIIFLKEKNVDVKGLKIIDNGKTFFWEGYYENDMNQAHTVKTELNVFETFDPILPPEWVNSKYVFLANIDPHIQLELIQQLKSPKLIVCDTMNFWITSKKEQLLEVMKRVDIMLLNEGEACQLFNTTNLITAAKQVLNLGVKTVIIKKGSHGALMFNKDSIYIVPAVPIENIIDPTGAGDSFAGGFISYLEHNKKLDSFNLHKALAYASVVASFNVQDFGTRSLATKTIKDINQRYKALMKMTHF